MSKENPNKETRTPQQPGAKDEALFQALGKSRKQKKHRLIRTVVISVLVALLVISVAVGVLRQRVKEQFSAGLKAVESYEASLGTISTLVSGSGTIGNVDTEAVTVPLGVDVTDIFPEAGDTVTEGDLIATVDMSTVRSAMSSLQTAIEELDDQISDAEGDKVSTYIRSGVSGRVKRILAAKDMTVAEAMVEHGALAVLSLDGYMALELETNVLSAGDAVTVLREDGTSLTGFVDAAAAGKAEILVSDNGTKYGEKVSVLTSEGKKLGTGELYIHDPLAITGYAGTVSYVNAMENQLVYSGTTLFTLKNTASSANYDALLRQRSDTEETLLELLKIQRSGGVVAPISGSIYTVGDPETEGMTEVAVISPDVSMSVIITVDEADILSLAEGQEADITVSSATEEKVSGIVTELDKTAASGYYTAEVTMDKIPGMLPGMTADVDIRIEGVENAVLIPVDALHQTSTGAFVYTTYDEASGEYGGRVDVTTGLSNDDYVEITAGLKPGDVVYYTERTNLMDMFGAMGFGGNRNPGNSQQGQRPQMPSGGNSGVRP